MPFPGLDVCKKRCHVGMDDNDEIVLFTGAQPVYFRNQKTPTVVFHTPNSWLMKFFIYVVKSTRTRPLPSQNSSALYHFSSSSASHSPWCGVATPALPVRFPAARRPEKRLPILNSLTNNICVHTPEKGIKREMRREEDDGWPDGPMSTRELEDN